MQTREGDSKLLGSTEKYRKLQLGSKEEEVEKKKGREREGFEGDIPFKAECSEASHSLHIVWL